MFEVYEERLQTLIKKSETPALGLLGSLLPEDARHAIVRDISVTPSVRGFIDRLDQYPALFGVWLAEHVMLGLGQDGHFSLYPYIQRALGGVSQITNPEREVLWWAFRRALFKLGIQPLPRVSGNHYMADEYIRQAGVPIAFADDLAGRMLRLARRIGLPDEDDQEGLLTWQSTLLTKLGPPFSVTARKAVERDTLGYYTRAFVRVHLNGGQATSLEPLELAIAKAFAQDGATAIKRAAIPQLLYRDGALGIYFPASETSSVYSIQAGTSNLTVRSDEGGTFRMLPPGLHKEVVVRREDGDKVLAVGLWPDQMSNRLLVFNADGRLRASAQLNQGDPVELSPGQYVALCRFEPSNNEDWFEVSESPCLVEVPLDLRPGSEVVLKNGPASVRIVGEERPSLTLTGQSKASLEGIEFWYHGLQVAFEVPADWRASSQSFELRVRQGENQVSVPIALTPDGKGAIDLLATLGRMGLKPGLQRVVLELARNGEARALQRQSILYWHGLHKVSYGLRFECSHMPQNLISRLCEGVTIGQQDLQPGDEHSRLIRIAFDIGGGRITQLSWHRPGVFVEVQVPGPDGTSKSIPRPLGATETVSVTSDKTIVVSASEPGYIVLGDMRQYVDFSRRPSRTFPASFLASRLSPGARTLMYVTEAGTPKPILELSQPHIVTDVTTNRLGNLLEIKMTVAGEPTDVSISGREISSGREAQAEHELLAGIWHINDLARMQVYSAPAVSSHVIHVLVDVESLKPGVWILDFGARVGGVWGRLQDGDEGRIAVALAVGPIGQELPGKDVVAEAAELGLPDAAQRLARLNEHYRQCWSPVCWEQQSWLLPYFNALVERLRDHESEHITELADMATARTPEDVRPGFMSMQFAPALLPRTFALRRDWYRRVNTRAHPMSVVLRAMSDIHPSITPSFGVLLHTAAAVPFKNSREVMLGKRPLGFSLGSYRAVLAASPLDGAYRLDDEAFLPDRGELLGPLHLAHAWRDLERGFTNSQLLPNNRKNAALALANKLSLRLRTFDRSAPAGLRGESLLLSVRPVNAALDPSLEIKRDQMEHIALALAWLAWHCRLEPRRPGTLAAFEQGLTVLRHQVAIPDATVQNCIAYYLQVAPAMFAFYLLLWELAISVEFDPVVQNV